MKRLTLVTPIKEYVRQTDLTEVTFARSYLTAGDLLRARRASQSKDEYEISLHIYAGILGLDIRDIEAMDVRDIAAIDAVISEIQSPKV